MARRFFYVCAGLLCLAIAYHLGARAAGAQAGSAISGFSTASTSHCSGTFFVITSSGDVFGKEMRGGLCGSLAGPPSYIGNFWAGSGPIPVNQESFGSLKARHR